MSSTASDSSAAAGRPAAANKEVVPRSSSAVSVSNGAGTGTGTGTGTPGGGGVSTAVAVNMTGRHKHKHKHNPRNKRVSLKFQARNFVKTRHFGEALCEHYQLGEKIGEGAFGEVFAAVHKVTGAERAVKVIYKAAATAVADRQEEHEQEQEDEKANAIIRNEFATVNSLDHVSSSTVLYCIVWLYYNS